MKPNKTARENIIDFVKAELVGPNPMFMHDDGVERIKGDTPISLYLAGILFPRQTKIKDGQVFDSVEHEETGADDSPSSNSSEGKIEDNIEDFINLSNAHKQSAISITVKIIKDDDITIVCDYATYAPVIIEGENYFERHPVEKTIHLDKLPLSKSDKPVIFDVIDDGSLMTAISFRSFDNDGIIYTISMINNIESKENASYHNCFFQCSIKVISNLGLLPLPEKTNLLDDDDELATLMLYRNKRRFGVGHGCSVIWNQTNGGVHNIETTFIPESNVLQIIPSSINNIEFSMYEMSKLDNRESSISVMKEMACAYENWIKALEDQTSELAVEFIRAAKNNISYCFDYLSRIRKGILLIENNNEALQAFCFMNESMLNQQIRYKIPKIRFSINKFNKIEINDSTFFSAPSIDDPKTWPKGNIGKWRPFQLAFILANIEGIIDPLSEERRKVDLIWFPTGGGKTEAYLGLSAFTIFYERLKNPQVDGTRILTRYTLRLLTSQQFDRSAALITAIEYIRSKHENMLGKNRITIGLFVGGDTTPNTNNEAVSLCNQLRNNPEVQDHKSFIITKCPWCGAEMGAIKNGRYSNLVGYRIIRASATSRRQKFAFVCSNPECNFNTDENPLPLSVVDEDIFENPPTMVVGTVDKFAGLPRRIKMGRLFGYEDGNRFCPPPNLIIQDELHLISGPLGSTVGLYETMIQELCALKIGDKRLYPKIVASTATISRARDQVCALYACEKDNVRIFPPQGIDAGESFFARVGHERPARKYVGIFTPNSSSNATSGIRLISSLLASTDAVYLTSDERDAYWTVISYFNSIRELGQAATWLNSDIPDYLSTINTRSKLSGKNRVYREIRNAIELTSRKNSNEINLNFGELEKHPYGQTAGQAVDVCLATNMISVGLDIQRLGLMVVYGQPKTTAEYIQTTSRVGRDEARPGLIFTLYNSSRPRDRSIFENFCSYHDKYYSFVEPTSVTPFSIQLRKRALAAVFIGLFRIFSGSNTPQDFLGKREIVKEIRSIILARIRIIEPSEVAATIDELDMIEKIWINQNHAHYTKMNNYYSNGQSDELTLISDEHPDDKELEKATFVLPNSMRNVDVEIPVNSIFAYKGGE